MSFELDLMQQEVSSCEVSSKMAFLQRIAYLEAQNEEQQKINALQTHDIIKLEDKVERIHNFVYQLIPSLFNFETQRKEFERHVDLLFGKLDGTDEYYRSLPSSGGNYATTRQGDLNQARIEQLEKMVQQLLSRNEEEEMSESSKSVDTNYSEERIKTSYSLCGNE